MPSPPGGAGSGEDHLAHELRLLLRDHLGDHAAHREPEQVDLVEAEGTDEGDGVARHLLDRRRRGPAGGTDASGADLARAINITPQAMNGVLATLEREALIERHPHPTHGRILQATLTSEGQRRLDAANPAVRALERAIERDFTPDEIATIKTWLVTGAQRLERATESRTA